MTQVVAIEMSAMPVVALGTRGEVRGVPAPASGIGSVCSFDALLNDEERWQVRTLTSQVTFAAGTVLFDEGRVAEDIFHVERGVAMIYKLMPDGRRTITDFVYPGEFIGLNFAEFYTHGAETISRTTLCRLPRRRLEQALKRLPRLEQRISMTLRKDLAAAQDRLLWLGRKTATERVASFLLDLSRRAALRDETPCSLWLPMRREAIGDHLGLALETVSRSLSDLKRRGLIVLREEARIDLCDLAALRRIADGR
jgi:CRP/FNR family transcriptional regulator